MTNDAAYSKADMMPTTPYVTKAEFKSLVDTLDRWRVAIQTKQEKHDKTLYGNGDPGMDEQLRDIVKWINKQEETAKRRAAWWDKLQWVVIPIAIGGFITFVYQAFIFYFRIVPFIEAVK